MRRCGKQADAFFTGGPDLVDNDQDAKTGEILQNRYREEEALKGKAKSIEFRAADNTVYYREENNWRIRNLLVSPDGTELRFAETHAGVAFSWPPLDGSLIRMRNGPMRVSQARSVLHP